MDLVTRTDLGLYCPPGDFYVDPWRAVDRAVITHAHSDHARPGSRHYLAADIGADILRHRLGSDIALQAVPYGQVIDHRGVRVSLHPAGHLLGAAQVRIEHDGKVAVVTGDFKVHADPTCARFEQLRCDHLVTESTFGLPIYRWPDPEKVRRDINAWWAANRDEGVTSIIYAYVLGKAQRVLAGLDAEIGPILLHGSIDAVTQLYRRAGVALPPTQHATPEAAKKHRGKAMVIAPMSADDSPWMRKFEPASTAIASGWMMVRGTRRYRSADRGFVLSDHADWDGLLRAIDASGAKRVDVTHGYSESLARYLRESRRIDARKLETGYSGEALADPEEAKTAAAPLFDGGTA